MFQLFGTRRTIDLTDFEFVDSSGPSPDDLPCPWCHAPTTESDPTCPSCERRFGSFDVS